MNALRREQLVSLTATTGAREEHRGRLPGVHAVRPLRWHDAGVEIVQLLVPGLH